MPLHSQPLFRCEAAGPGTGHPHPALLGVFPGGGPTLCLVLSAQTSFVVLSTASLVASSDGSPFRSRESRVPAFYASRPGCVCDCCSRRSPAVPVPAGVLRGLPPEAGAAPSSACALRVEGEPGGVDSDRCPWLGVRGQRGALLLCRRWGSHPAAVGAPRIWRDAPPHAMCWSSAVTFCLTEGGEDLSNSRL